MTRVTVNAGNCNFTVTVRAGKAEGKKIHISLDTECEMVMKMLEDISELDMKALFMHHVSNPVYRSASRHLKHAACPVPCAILKASEVELGVCLPQDIAITFEKNGEV